MIFFKVIVLSVLFFSIAFQGNQDEYKIPISEIYLSDPFIFADYNDSTYYMYGSGGNGTVMCRAIKDLKLWTDRFVVFRFPENHRAGPKAPSWAAEVHKYKGKYYLFTTSDDGKPAGKNIRGENYPRRATQIYVADSPRGPFMDLPAINRIHLKVGHASTVPSGLNVASHILYQADLECSGRAGKKESMYSWQHTQSRAG